jgi:hypothetical protein
MSVFRDCVDYLNICCPAEYIRQTRMQKPEVIAARLGVCVRTVRNWRLWVRKGKIKCENSAQCARPCEPSSTGLPTIVVHRTRRR